MEDQNQPDKNSRIAEKNDEFIGLPISRIKEFREVLEATARVLIGVSVLSYILGLLMALLHEY